MEVWASNNGLPLASHYVALQACDCLGYRPVIMDRGHLAGQLAGWHKTPLLALKAADDWCRSAITGGLHRPSIVRGLQHGVTLLRNATRALAPSSPKEEV